MGVLAPLGFIVLLLTIGFRYNNWTLSFVVFLLSSVFAILLGVSNIEEVKKAWNERRCDIDILVTAQLYKPADDTRTGGEFAAENFNFCVKSIMLTVLSMALSPIYTLLNQQLDLADSVADIFNRMRLLQANFMNGFTKLLDPFFKRFKTTGSQFGVTYQKMLSAMGRAVGITQAILYIGMSLVLAIENFVHLVINVIMIVMYIILGLMILLFFMIIPVFGIIINTCMIIGNSPFGYLSEDVCGELCFDPTTRVRLQNNIIKPLKDCVIGDVFDDGTETETGTRIEGILEVAGDKEPIFVLDGIRVSGAHLVYFEEKKSWIPVAHHPNASLSLQPCPRLFCLRTSTRNIPLEGLQKSWRFRDWEELPTNLPHVDTVWDFVVSEILNGKPQDTSVGVHVHVPTEHPLLRKGCQVMYKTGEMRDVGEIRIGDEIYSSVGFTKVTGLYKGEAEFAKDSFYTDGIWMKGITENEWKHPHDLSKEVNLERGFHVTTESGCFWIQTKDFSGFVRDFTEVGTHNLFLTYPYTQQLLKKSFNREESCDSVSLLQGLLSSLQPIY